MPHNLLFLGIERWTHFISKFAEGARSSGRRLANLSLRARK